MAVDVLPPQHQIVLASVADAAEPERLLPLLERPDLDWQELDALGRRNRLSPFVARLLESEPLRPHVGEEHLARWHDERERQIERVAYKLRQLRELGEALARRGLLAYVYKGPDFQERYYTSDCPRAFNDLDIVVPRAAARATARLLEELGYSLPPGTPPLDYFLRFHLHAIYLNPEGRHPVELHWALDSPYAGLGDPVPLLLESAEGGAVFGPGLVRPGPIDALALMVLHLEKHVGPCAALPTRERRLEAVLDEGGLFWVLDAVRWLERDEASPDAVLERLRRLGAERSLVIALRLARDVEPGALPDWATELAERLPHGRPVVPRLLYPALRRPLRERWRHLLFGTVPVLAFRPARVVEALLPTFRVPGVVEPAPEAGTAAPASGGRFRLLLANLAALVTWKLGLGVGKSRAADVETRNSESS